MGRMHGQGKGISKRVIPYKRTPPSWLKIKSEEVEDKVCKLARKGLSPSQIGVVLRDSHGVGLVKNVTGKKIVRILQANGLQPDIPEDLYSLLRSAVIKRKHISRMNNDKVARYHLKLIEAKIHRITRYYKRIKVLAPNWKYTPESADALVS